MARNYRNTLIKCHFKFIRKGSRTSRKQMNSHVRCPLGWLRATWDSDVLIQLDGAYKNVKFNRFNWVIQNNDKSICRIAWHKMLVNCYLWLFVRPMCRVCITSFEHELLHECEKVFFCICFGRSLQLFYVILWKVHVHHWKRLSFD